MPQRASCPPARQSSRGHGRDPPGRDSNMPAFVSANEPHPVFTCPPLFSAPYPESASTSKRFRSTDLCLRRTSGPGHSGPPGPTHGDSSGVWSAASACTRSSSARRDHRVSLPAEQGRSERVPGRRRREYAGSRLGPLRRRARAMSSAYGRTCPRSADSHCPT